jgi:hypothetical protein
VQPALEVRLDREPRHLDRVEAVAGVFLELLPRGAQRPDQQARVLVEAEARGALDGDDGSLAAFSKSCWKPPLPISPSQSISETKARSSASRRSNASVTWRASNTSRPSSRNASAIRVCGLHGRDRTARGGEEPPVA